MAEVRERDIERDQLKGLLLGTLMGAIVAAGGGDILQQLSAEAG